MFHNELANFASVRLLLIAAIVFVQVVAQLFKPHLIVLLRLTRCLLRWSCAWVKMRSRSTVWKLYVIRIILLRNQMPPSIIHVCLHFCKQSICCNRCGHLCSVSAITRGLPVVHVVEEKFHLKIFQPRMQNYPMLV